MARNHLLDGLKMKITTTAPGVKNEQIDLSKKNKSVSNKQAVKNLVAKKVTEEVGHKFRAGLDPKLRQAYLDKEKELTDNHKYTIKDVRKEFMKTIGVDNDYIKTERSTKSIREKYKIITKIFWRLITRTPYDEDYEYTWINYNEVKGNMRTGYYTVNRATKRKHIADNDVVKNDWVLFIKTDKSKYKIDEKIYRKYNTELTNSELWVSLADEIFNICKGEDFYNFEFENRNKRVDDLEFGRYAKTDISKAKEQHKGDNRFHGLHDGYSVQAPRGFIRITAQEFNNTVIEAESSNPSDDEIMYKTKRDKNKVSSPGYYFTASDIGFNKEVSKSLKQISNKGTFGGTNAVYNKDYFEEKELLEDLIRGLPKVDINVTTLNEKFSKDKHYFGEYAAKIENKINKKVKEDKKQQEKNKKENKKEKVAGEITTNKCSEKVDLSFYEKLKKDAKKNDDDIDILIMVGETDCEGILSPNGKIIVNYKGRDMKLETALQMEFHKLNTEIINKALESIDQLAL